MHGTYLQNKQSIYNWRDKNKEKYKAISSKGVAKYQNWKKIQKVFFHILLDI
jgi:hypothetical protein